MARESLQAIAEMGIVLDDAEKIVVSARPWPSAAVFTSECAS